jgi:hypothetical protein
MLRGDNAFPTAGWVGLPCQVLILPAALQGGAVAITVIDGLAHSNGGRLAPRRGSVLLAECPKTSELVRR